jgi:FdhD protein
VIRRAAIAVVRRRTPAGLVGDQDLVAVEAALDVRVVTAATLEVTPLGILMRTPGDDEDLLRGLLFAEGAIRTRSDIAAIELAPATDESGDAAVVRLADHVVWDAGAGRRVGPSSSACGLCGRLTALAVDTGRACRPGAPRLALDLVQSLPERLRAGQTVFGETGGLHAAALFDALGASSLLREDVGRHNAVDKAIGAAIDDGSLSQGPRVLAVSGRVAFEIVQKAAMAGVAAIIAVGGPAGPGGDAPRAPARPTGGVAPGRGGYL